MSIERTKYMDDMEVNQLRTVTAARAVLDIQEGRLAGVIAWAVVDAALSTGLRVSELARLQAVDLDLRRLSLRVKRSKKRRETVETLPISRELADHLRQYVDWLGLLAGGDGGYKGPLFPSQRRQALTPAGLQQVWKAAIRRAGLPKELSIHSARHTLAVVLLRKTKNLRLVQQQLGHSSPTITANMYAVVTWAEHSAGLDGLYGDGAAVE